MSGVITQPDRVSYVPPVLQEEQLLTIESEPAFSRLSIIIPVYNEERLLHRC